MTEYLVFDKLAGERVKEKIELRQDEMVIFFSGVNIGEKSAVMVEHGFRVGCPGYSRVRLGERAHCTV